VVELAWECFDRADLAAGGAELGRAASVELAEGFVGEVGRSMAAAGEGDAVALWCDGLCRDAGRNSEDLVEKVGGEGNVRDRVCDAQADASSVGRP
jgi:hypothetical protein